MFYFKLVHLILPQCSNLNSLKQLDIKQNMIKAEVQWLQRNDLTRLDYDARYAAE